MNTPHEHAEVQGAERIVYVRPVNVEDLPEEVRAETGDSPIFAVHAPNGDRLALVRDRKLAFLLARQNDYTPVSVH